MAGRRVALILATLAAGAIAAGCGGKKEAPKDPPPPQVMVIRPVAVEVSDYWSYNGYLEASETVEVRSKIRGYLAKRFFVEGDEVKETDVLYEIDKMEYETAFQKAKAEVAKAEADLLKAEADLVKAQAAVPGWEAQLTQAKEELAIKESSSAGTPRTELIAAKAAVGVKTADLASAKAQVKFAEANVKAAEGAKLAAEAAQRTTKIQLDYTDVKAKISGRIGETRLDRGALIQADSDVLAVIRKVDELYVYFDAPEADFLDYQRSPGALTPGGAKGPSIPVQIGVTGEEGFPHEGWIDFQDNRVETSTGTLRVRGRLKNPLRPNGTRVLMPGLYARVRVPKGKSMPLPVIPEDCLMSGQEGRYVYVVGADNKVQKRVVTVGPTVWKVPRAAPGETPPVWVAVNPKPGPPPEGQPPPPTRRPIKSVVAITSGLKTDDRVILDGLQRAQPTRPVTPEEWTLTPPADKK